MTIEIGFGNGEFLLDQAARRPEVNFVGIERSAAMIGKCLKRLGRLPLDNVRLVHADALESLGSMFEEDSVGEAWIQFSDPWPKRRHHPRRLVQPAFIKTLAAKLAPGSRLTLATDHAAYAERITRVLEAQPSLRSRFGTPFVHQIPGRTPTKYERQALESGSPVYYFIWRKYAEPTFGYPRL